MHRYIALDTETTGVDFCSSQVIQCGAVFLDERNETVGTAEWNINYKPDTFSWDTEAEAVHGIARENAPTHGLEPAEFIREFERDIVKHYGIRGDSEVHIIAANAYFDYLMMDMLWNTYNKEYEMPLSRRVMDLSSLSLMVLGTAGMTTVMEALGIPADDDKRHSALYDAELHLRIFRSLTAVAKQEGITPY